MAIRPVFIAEPSGKFAYTIANVEFPWFGGFARVQKEKCIHALHEAYLLEHREAKILEISSYSQEPLGQQLSAFHLKFQAQNGLEYPVECIFQSSKIFENGSQYAELRSCSPREAKKDPRLKSSGPLKSFSLDSCIFPLEPKTFFYNWVYINALRQNQKNARLAEALLHYDAFTDIAFNPKISFNCQGEAAAIYVSLTRDRVIDKALSSPEAFKKIVYGLETEWVEPSLF